MAKTRKYVAVVYQGGAVYEPAEGGYYVPVSEIVYVSTACNLSDARKRLCHIMEDLYETENIEWAWRAPDLMEATLTTGRYVGDFFEIHIERIDEIGKNEIHYNGYC